MKAIGWCCLLLGLLRVSPASAAPPTVNLTGSAVEITGMAPGGRIAVFSIARRSLEYVERVERQEEIVVDEDQDGAVTLDLKEPLPWRSLWLAVDLASGEFSAVSPKGFPLRQLAFPAQGIGAARNEIQDRRDFLEIFLVRPGAGAEAGAWGLSAGDGGESDADGRQDRSLKVLLSDLHPVGQSPQPPERLSPGDVLVAVDPNQMEFYAVRLGGD